jgi:UDP-N-acetyl-D-mannosaminuronic acid transferase (WecB/TagA/CpsF family)
MIKANKNQSIINFYGIKFYNISYENIMKKLNSGGYLVAPAAYPLSKIKIFNNYFNALKNSKIAIFDSGYFCVLLMLLNFSNVRKFSGYLFLNKFLDDIKNKNKKILLINPTKNDGIENRKLLYKKGFTKVFLYTAPIYNLNQKVTDKKIVKLINKIKPTFVLLNIGGFKQELLAEHIHNKIKFKIISLCLGAAIAFITKKQAPINYYIDKLYMGWLIRMIFRPKEHFKRTIESFSLIKLFI